MRGPVNAKIKLTIMRKGQDKPIDVAIIRDVIRVQSVRSHTEGDDAHTFGDAAAGDDFRGRSRAATHFKKLGLKPPAPYLMLCCQ